MADDNDPGQPFKYCSEVYEVLKTVVRQRNACSPNESVRAALEDLERYAN